MECILKIEKNCWNRLDEYFSSIVLLHGKVLYVSDENIDHLFGHRIKPILKKYANLKEQFVDNNTIEYAMDIAERVIATDIQFIVGLGGGKVLDICKYAAYVSKTKFISIPTIVSNDGIASPIAVLKRQDGKPKSLGCAIPYALFVDLEVIMKSPIKYIKAGIGDTLSNYTALYDWKLAVKAKKENMKDLAYLMSSTALDTLLNCRFTQMDYPFIKSLVQSLVLSGIAMDFAGTSRPCSGAEHLFSHALDYYSKQTNLHGLQVALGSIVMAKLQNRKYDFLLTYLKNFDVQINPKILNITKEDFILCMNKAKSLRPDKYTILDEVTLNDALLSSIYDELCEEL